MSKLAALRQLKTRLREYQVLPTSAPAERRWQSYLSLLAVIKFIETEDDRQGLDSGLTALLVALTDVEAGNKVEWLANTPQYRPRKTIVTAAQHSNYAAIMELQMKRGLDRESAARFVARHIDGGKSVTWQTVATWRDRATGSTEHVAEKSAYEAMLARPREPVSVHRRAFDLTPPPA